MLLSDFRLVCEVCENFRCFVAEALELLICDSLYGKDSPYPPLHLSLVKAIPCFDLSASGYVQPYLNLVMKLPAFQQTTGYGANLMPRVVFREKTYSFSG